MTDAADPVVSYASGRDQTVRRLHQSGRWSVLDPRLDIKKHCLAGFGWGYGGSGPSQLAIAILADATGDDQEALDHYHAFKWAVIAELTHQEPFVIDAEAVRGWLQEHRTRLVLLSTERQSGVMECHNLRLISDTQK